MPAPNSNRDRRQQFPPEQYAQLRAELKAPYRGLRQFVYVTFAASGLLGAFIFLAKFAQGEAVSSVLPNFALQVGVVALMVWLFRLEQKKQKKQEKKELK
ncbi:DUF3493 domain-containing protein [Geitlerinema sp. PCC 9228]|jgi:hypothetical protein|uniref:DUF3493 domain-containing protein n=1 Tax=Geitlerinema sp. PCC 9228 TaxID=111611 RepID=UPI0008F9C898|nr:DUF3493 domain-containing protein [Geitlerinema sp. PCC 9228]